MRGAAIHDNGAHGSTRMIRCCSKITIANGVSPFIVTANTSRSSCSQAPQAGLNCSLVLKKREGYRRALDNFDPEKAARCSEKQIQTLLADPSIIRNRMKIEAAVCNARALLTVREELGNFDSYCWRFIGGQPKLNRWKTTRQIPATFLESETFSRDHKHQGFSFVGPTVMYAYMQDAGMVNDQLVECFRYREIIREVADAN